MLAVTHLAGFGVGARRESFRVVTGSAVNTNTPSIPVDLGPVGLKQVFLAFGVFDTVGNDPWTFAAGTLDGDALTPVFILGREAAGNGNAVGVTSGATICTIETTKGGVVNAAISPVGFSGVWNEIEMMAIIATGMSTAPLSATSGSPFRGVNTHLPLTTTDASLVIGVGTSVTVNPPGLLTGPGSPMTPVGTGRVSIGYDRSPPAGASTYDFEKNTYVIAGAAFGPA